MSPLKQALAAYDRNPKLRDRIDRGRLVGLLKELLKPQRKSTRPASR